MHRKYKTDWFGDYVGTFKNTYVCSGCNSKHIFYDSSSAPRYYIEEICPFCSASPVEMCLVRSIYMEHPPYWIEDTVDECLEVFDFISILY